VRACVTEHGFPLEQALSLVTRNTARILKLEMKGTLEKGKWGDILLLEKGLAGDRARPFQGRLHGARREHGGGGALPGGQHAGDPPGGGEVPRPLAAVNVQPTGGAMKTTRMISALALAAMLAACGGGEGEGGEAGGAATTDAGAAGTATTDPAMTNGTTGTTDPTVTGGTTGGATTGLTQDTAGQSPAMDASTAGGPAGTNSGASTPPAGTPPPPTP
jgi:hypothetical protein